MPGLRQHLTGRHPAVSQAAKEGASRLTTRAVAGLAAAGLLVVGLAGCSFVSGSSDANDGAQATAPTSGSTPGLAGTERTIGPLHLTAAAYWGPAKTRGDDTHVSVGGCQSGKPCPGFDIVTGSAATKAGKSNKTYLPKGSRCPGNQVLTAVVASGGAPPTSDATTVGGQRATRSELTLDCRNAAGTVVQTATQVQWYVPDAPSGPTLVVDRWALAGLDARLASATWSK